MAESPDRWGLTFHERHGEIVNEAFARPSVPLDCPAMVTRLTIMPTVNKAFHDIAADHLAMLCRSVDRDVPARDARHFVLETDDWSLTWERHTEFISFTFITSGEADLTWQKTPLDILPDDLISGLPGPIVSATHIAVTPVSYETTPVAQARRSFGEQEFTAMKAPQAPIVVAANFKPSNDGFVRIILFDDGADDMFRGRLTQRLLEIDFYRLAALLALPVARSLTREIGPLEDELEACLLGLTGESSPQDDARLLNRLAQIAGEIEKLEHSTRYRFDAGRAYYQIVQDRISRLREERIEGQQRISNFMEHRLAPAMRTCEAVRSRLKSLEERVARGVSLLSTRVSVSMQQQNSKRLEALNQRADAQLRLQQTVEGLSTVAISYYAVGLVQYALKALDGAGGPDIVSIGTGLSIPIIILLVFFGVRRLRQEVTRDRGH